MGLTVVPSRHRRPPVTHWRLTAALAEPVIERNTSPAEWNARRPVVSFVEAVDILSSGPDTCSPNRQTARGLWQMTGAVVTCYLSAVTWITGKHDNRQCPVCGHLTRLFISRFVL